MILTSAKGDLFQVALRVWIQYNTNTAYAEEDVEILKLAALPEERRLRIDMLACAIIRRELA